MKKKSVVSYVEFGVHGHRPVWLKKIAEVFIDECPDQYLSIWIPKSFKEVHKQWYETIYSTIKTRIRFNFYEDYNILFSKLSDIQVILKCIKIDEAAVCFVGNKIDHIIKDMNFILPFTLKTKIVGIMDAPFLHYSNFSSVITRRWLTRGKYFKSFVKHFIFFHRIFVKSILVLDPLAVTFYKRKMLSNKIHFIPEYIYTSNEFSEVIIENKEKINYLFIGPITERKGIIKLLDAFEFLALNNPNWLTNVKLTVAGKVDESILEKIERLVSHVNAIAKTEVIIFENRLLTDEEFVNYIGSSDIICIPYIRQYTTSNILIQSCYMGKPVIASDFGIVGELIKRFNLGITCDPDNIVSITNGLLSIAEYASKINMNDVRRIKSFGSEFSINLNEFAKKVCENLIN
jgi:glycosyltransferase involved in cell wall biosynthesis